MKRQGSVNSESEQLSEYRKEVGKASNPEVIFGVFYRNHYFSKNSAVPPEGNFNYKINVSVHYDDLEKAAEILMENGLFFDETKWGLSYQKTEFTSKEHRNLELIRFINFYNTVKPHKGIDGRTPYEKLLEYFDPKPKNTTT